MKICPACSREYDDEHEVCAQDGALLVHLDTGAGDGPEELVGQVIDGRYRIERVVGRGGMGTVYACRHVVVGKAFAMKVLRPGIERSEEVLQRFIREAQAANAIPSRHICQMTDFGQLRRKGGAFYVVMELLDGFSLTRGLRENRLDRASLLRVFIQIAETLEKAHAAGIIHRDLKPDNVMVVTDDEDPCFVKLVDFGIAKAMQSKAGDLTETGVILGTPFYMSPEQARGDRLDGRSDVYALGVMMYRAFTGKLPFVADTAMGVLTRHLTEKPELPSRLREIDRPLERLILRCLEKKPIDRFQGMSDVADALRSLDAIAPLPVDGLGQTLDDGAATRERPRQRRKPADDDHRATRVDTPAARPPSRSDDSITTMRAPSIPPALPHPALDRSALPAPPRVPDLASSAVSSGSVTSSSVSSDQAPRELTPGWAGSISGEPSWPPPPFAPSHPPPASFPPDGAYPGETNRGLVASQLGSLSPPAHGRRVAMIGGAAAIFVTIGAIAAIALVHPKDLPAPAPSPRGASAAPGQDAEDRDAEDMQATAAAEDEAATGERTDAQTPGDESAADEGEGGSKATRKPKRRLPRPAPAPAPKPAPRADEAPPVEPPAPTSEPPPAIDDGVRSPFD